MTDLINHGVGYEEKKRSLAVRFVPQWLAVVICTLARHPQKRYTAWEKGIQVVVWTCRCGRRQESRVYAANRGIRRGLGQR